MIEPKHLMIKEIFKTNFYEIPKYQRPYVWKKGTQVVDFWEDLIFQYEQEIKYNNETKTNLFLGTLILNKRKDDKFLVVDGQQRMTTIFILLVAIRNYLQTQLADPTNNFSSKELSVARNQLANIHPFISSSNLALGTTDESRLSASPLIKPTIEAMSDHNWTLPFIEELDGYKEVSPIYNFFAKMIIEDTKMENFGSFLTALYNSSCIVINIEDMEEAYNLFERTNARGQALTVSDLLKNHLFAKGNDEKISEFWDEITEDSGTGLTKMLRYFYVSRQGYIAQNKLYRALKEYGKEDSEKLVLEISDFSEYFKLFSTLDDEQKFHDYILSLDGNPEDRENIDPDRLYNCYQSINALEHFGMDQPKPLIYSFLKGFYRLKMHLKKENEPNKSKNRKTIFQFLKSLESYHFVNNVVCKRQTNEVEKLYAEFACKFYNAKTSDEFTAHLYMLYKKLQSQLAQIGEFSDNFADFGYKNKKAEMLYIFDRLNNTQSNGERRASADWKQTAIFEPHRIPKSSYTLEHWAPQVPKDEKTDIETSPLEEVHSIGNLIVLATTTNSKLGNKNPAEKAKYLDDSEMNTLPYNKKFITTNTSKFDSWDDKAIKERTKKMADDAYSLVWKFTPPMLEPEDKSLITPEGYLLLAKK